jgi:uncharacterized protein with HEPN domain
MAAATDCLATAATHGDPRRFTDDDLYRYAIAFLWLRLVEPATRLLTLRLVDRDTVPGWESFMVIRNSLAHDRNEEIDYSILWGQLPETVEAVRDELDLLPAS